LLSEKGLSVEEIRSDNNYRDLARADEWSIWNLLFHAGYCTAILDSSNPTKFLLKIPNDEVRQTLKDEIEDWKMELTESDRWIPSLLEHALKGSFQQFKDNFCVELAKSFSYHDIAGGDEKIYHALSLGLFVGGTNYNYKVESNKESGHGRYDLQLSPHHPTAGKRSIIIEFKVLRDIRSEDYSVIESKLRTLAEDGLNQIQIRQYHINVPNWCTEVYECGVAFYKKYCVILSRQLHRHSAEQNWSILSSDI